jgi:hypothetical protein
VIIVVRKLIDPIIEEIPARCKLKIPKSTEIPLWYIEVLRGGYTVQPVPTPLSKIEDNNSKEKAGIKSQNLKLFIRGKIISTTPNNKGINQFPKPPIEIGITAKKIMIKAWAVTITLYK